MKYKVIIEKEKETSGYSAFVPALPGCASQGENISETISNIKEAIKLYLLSLKDDNLPLPKEDVEIFTEEVEVG
ncbi:MAG: type II toxin-antitoxin system HicB family antitoxin, partial [Candidatus Omnitrophota bacterium]